MTITYNEFQITSTLKGDKKANWGNDFENWNYHIITVTNKVIKKRAQFSFWASMKHPNIETEYDLLNAFYCFVSDAISGEMDFSEFCSEFGYDEDSRRAAKVWRACKRSTKSVKRIYNGDIYNLYNALAGIAV